jgi:hypothetical protein
MVSSSSESERFELLAACPWLLGRNRSSGLVGRLSKRGGESGIPSGLVGRLGKVGSELDVKLPAGDASIWMNGEEDSD